MPAITQTDATGKKSPALNVATLVLCPPPGCECVTVRADAAGGSSPTKARYSNTVLTAGAQSEGDGSRAFDLAGDIPIPCKGMVMIFFALDTGTADWQWVFEVPPTVR